MMERVKTAILLFLVILSFFLTYRLWYGSPLYEKSMLTFQEPFFYEEPRTLEGTVTPAKAVFPVNDNRYLLYGEGKEGFPDLWSSTFQALNFANSVEDMSLIQGADPSVILYFDPVFPLDKGRYRFARENFDAISMMEIFVNEKIWFLVRGNEETRLLMVEPVFAGSLLEELTNILEVETLLFVRMGADRVFDEWGIQLDTPAGHLYVLDQETEIHSINLKKESVCADDLLKTFFVDKNLVRTIAARDDTFIYTDGEKGLCISLSVEYSAPRLEDGTTTLSYRAAVQRANELLCYHGGWPVSLRLEEVLAHEIGFRTYYYVRWVYYHNGLPIIGEGGSVWFNFNDKGISYYERALFFPTGVSTESFQIAPVAEAVAAAIMEYEEQGGTGPIKLNEVYLAYYLEKAASQTRAFPVWVIKINGNSIILNGENLNLISIGEPNGYIQG